MKTKTFLSLAAAAGIAVSGFVGHASANPHRAGGPGARPAIMERVIKALELSPEQTEKIKGELRSEKENVLPLLQKLHEARKELRETIQTETDEKGIRETHAKVAAVEADLAVHRAKVRAKIVPHLTAEQLQKLEKIEERMDEMAQQGLERFEKRGKEYLPPAANGTSAQ